MYNAKLIAEKHSTLNRDSGKKHDYLEMNM